MNAILRRCALASLGLASLTVPARAIDIISPWPASQCIAGTCTNGSGTVRIPDGTEYTGRWTGGQLTGGTTFRVRSPLDANRVNEIAVNADATELRGAELRGHGIGGVEGEYSGTFAEVANPFINGKTYAYRVGRYTDRNSGYIYDGRFSYLPTLNNRSEGGYYVFQGARIDEANNEVLSGLFVSDFQYTSTHYPLRFTKARPDYLAKLKREFAESLARVADEKRQTAEARRIRDAQAAESARQSADSMASMMGIIGGFIALGNQRGNNSLTSLQDSLLSTLTNDLTGQQTGGDALKDILSQIIQQAGNDPALARMLGNISDRAQLIETLGRLSKTNTPTTVTQYERRSPVNPKKPSPTVAKKNKKAIVAAKPPPPPPTTVVKSPLPDWDALGALGGPGPPDTVPFTVRCGSSSQAGMIPVADGTNCVAEFKAFSSIRCFPGWPMHKTNIDRLRCAAQKSRGTYKTEYSRMLEGARQLIRQHAPDCDARFGCTGSSHLGNK